MVGSLKEKEVSTNMGGKVIWEGWADTQVGLWKANPKRVLDRAMDIPNQPTAMGTRSTGDERGRKPKEMPSLKVQQL